VESRADAVVLFGATGDLVRKKLMPALYQMAKAGRLGVPVIGVARSAWGDARLRNYAREAVEATAVGAVDVVAFGQLAESLTMLVGDYGDSAMYDELAKRLEGTDRPVFYLAIPPSVFPQVVQGLAQAGLAARGRVIVEKPFGRDQESARELNGWLAGAFEQRSIFRIDHYLGKESVEGLLVFRFADTFLEPFWNRNYVAGVQITLGEAFGTEGRAGFYDGVGAIRDVLQNHLLQVVALLAMEPPIADDADAYRDEEVNVLRQIRAAAAAQHRPGPVRRLPRRGGRRGLVHDGDVRVDLPDDRVVALGGGAVLPAGRQEHAGQRDRGGRRAAPATPAAVRWPGRRRAEHQPGALPPRPQRRRHSVGAGQGAGRPYADPAGRPQRRLRVGARPPPGGVRAAARRRAGRPTSPVRPRGHAREEWRIVDPILDLPDRPVPYYKGTWGPPPAHAPADGWHDVALRT